MRSLVDPRKLPAVVRRTLSAQCDGEWERVTTDDGGGYIVHNNEAKAMAYLAAPFASPSFSDLQPVPPPIEHADGSFTVIPVPYRTEPVRRQRGPARRRPVQDAQVRALKHVVESRPSSIQPGVNVVSADRAEAVSAWLTSHEVMPSDWEGISDEMLDLTSLEIHRHCEQGLPANVPFLYHPDVLAMEGFKDAEDEVRATIRYPDRVEIRPETGQKRYPILGFWRGDVNVILGMRNPNHPAVIAAYYRSLRSHDTHRVNRVGGGGAKRSDDGTPKTPPAVMRALRGLGAEIKGYATRNATSVTVLYEGQDLGQISVGTVPRATCERDWQRMQRKIDAIKRRASA